MDADRTERERMLEERIASLEARLLRLEGVIPAASAPSPAAIPLVTADAIPLATAAAIPPPASTATAPVPWATPTPGAMPAWMTASQAPPPSATVAIAGADAECRPCQPAPRPHAVLPPSSWVPPEPMFRLPAGWHLSKADFSGSFSDIEERMAGRALAWVGGLALVLGAIFFLSLAFSRGWIGEEGRVVIGLRRRHRRAGRRGGLHRTRQPAPRARPDAGRSRDHLDQPGGGDSSVRARPCRGRPPRRARQRHRGRRDRGACRFADRGGLRAHLGPDRAAVDGRQPGPRHAAVRGRGPDRDDGRGAVALVVVAAAGGLPACRRRRPPRGSRAGPRSPSASPASPCTGC